MKKIILTCLIYLCFSITAQAATSVYKIQLHGKTLYLGGTIHMLKDSDYPLPKAYDIAFKTSQTIVFEVNMDELTNSQIVGQMLQRMQYQDERTLKTVLNKETYQQLQQHAQRLNIDLKKLKKFKPFAIITMMLSIELKKIGVKQGGVDQYYFQRSMYHAKKTLGLETVLQQLDMMSNLGAGEENDFVRYSLNDFKNIKTQWKKMVQAWRTGNQQQLMREFVEPMQAMPMIYQKLLVERNQAWLPKIMQMLSDKSVEFILVGSAHLVGDDGLLNLLQQQGCTVTQM